MLNILIQIFKVKKYQQIYIYFSSSKSNILELGNEKPSGLFLSTSTNLAHPCMCHHHICEEIIEFTIDVPGYPPECSNKGNKFSIKLHEKRGKKFYVKLLFNLLNLNINWQICVYQICKFLFLNYKKNCFKILNSILQIVGDKNSYIR